MTTYYVYRIWNTQTNKSYIGITKNVKRRWSLHQCELKHQRHCNAKLQAAWNKYGASTFKFEVLDECLTVQDAKRLETQWIRRYDSYMNGFNLTYGGDYVTESVKRRVIWNGNVYDSLHAAAKACGIGSASMHQRLQRGYTCDEDMPQDRLSIPVLWNGQHYSSIGEAARHLGLDHETMRERVKKGYSCDDDLTSIGQGRARRVIWNGAAYTTLKSAGKANGLTAKAMQYRIEQGYTCDEDMQVPPKKKQS